MKKLFLVLPVVLLAIAGLLMMGCSSDGGGSDDSFVFSLGDFYQIDEDNPTQVFGWVTPDCTFDDDVTLIKEDSTLTWDILKSSKKLVLVMDGGQNTYHQLQVLLANEATGYWGGSEVFNSFEFASDAEDTVYFVIDLTLLGDYADYVSDTNGKAKLGLVSWWGSNVDEWGITAAYLTNMAIPKPASAENFNGTFGAAGYASLFLDFDFD